MKIHSVKHYQPEPTGRGRTNGADACNRQFVYHIIANHKDAVDALVKMLKQNGSLDFKQKQNAEREILWHFGKFQPRRDFRECFANACEAIDLDVSRWRRAMAEEITVLKNYLQI